MATSRVRWSFSAYMASTCWRTSRLGFCMDRIRNSSSSCRTSIACFYKNNNNKKTKKTWKKNINIEIMVKLDMNRYVKTFSQCNLASDSEELVNTFWELNEVGYKILRGTLTVVWITNCGLLSVLIAGGGGGEGGGGVGAVGGVPSPLHRVK